MSKPLLHKNTRSLLLWLPLVLFGASLLFYWMLDWHSHHMQEKQLLLKQNNIWAAFTSQPANFIRNIQGEYDIKEGALTGSIVRNKMRDTVIYYQDTKQLLPFEVLTTAYSWNGKTYLLSTYVSSKEIHHLVIKVFATEVFILLLLLLTIIIVNKRSSSYLWKPFFSTLRKVNQYNIAHNQNIDLPPSTGTTEFDELNKVITSLIGNVNQAYHQQKQFVENASHEMQTPLTIIRSKLELLINQPELNEKTASLLSDITEANDRLSHMSRTLLLLAKIENNQFPDVEEINLSSLLENMIENYRNHYDSDFPVLTQSIQPEKIIVANRSLIEILFSNLLKNAVEHNQPKGAIAITLHNSELSIKNTGAEPETEPNFLFERFRKDSHKSKSTGLGLALVKQICLLYRYPINYTYQNGWHELTVEFVEKMPSEFLQISE